MSPPQSASLAQSAPGRGDRAREIVGAVALGFAIYLLLRSVRHLIVLFGLFLSEADASEALGGVSPLRLSAFSILPFCFNLAFGLFFGRKCAARAAVERARGRRAAWINPWALGFLAWLLLFNLPIFLKGDPAAHSLVPRWPPESFYLPLHNELVLFYPMGNRALLAGFCGAIGLGFILPKR